jgi:hypothetical protein
MITLSLRLPESLHDQLEETVRREGISINQFISTAVAEKLAALMTVEYLEERVRRDDRSRFERVLSRVPDVEPDPNDRLDEPSA